MDNCPKCDAAYVDDDALYCHACGHKRSGVVLGYTVCMIVPDYIASQYGEEYYSAWVTARSPKHAAKKGKTKAAEDIAGSEAGDFLVVAVYSGHHPMLYSEAR